MLYTGHKCMICGKEFTEDDDVVVCVDCGTPYHRACYKQQGCVNTELHESGRSWKDENTAETVVCRRCGKSLSPDQRYCDRCGTLADGAAPFEGASGAQGDKGAPYGGMGSPGSPYGHGQGMPGGMTERIVTLEVRPEDIADEDVTYGELTQFVGPSAAYYMPRFAMINRFGFKLGLNIGALIFPELYFAYRKMPMTALGIMLLRMVLSLPALLVMLTIPEYSEVFITNFSSFPQIVDILRHIAEYKGAESISDLSTLISILDTVICLALGMWANYIYYRHALHKVHALKEADNSDYIPLSGGTSIPMLILFILMTSVRFIASLYIINAFI